MEGINPVSDAVIALVKTTVGKVVGNVVDKYIPVPMDEGKKLELKTEVQRLVVEELKADVELERIIAGDRDSARKRETEIIKAPEAGWLNKNIVPLLALGCLLLSFIAFFMFFWIGVTPEKKDVMIFLLTSLTTIDITILTYYFGSSHGSAKKDDRMRRLGS